MRVRFVASLTIALALGAVPAVQAAETSAGPQFNIMGPSRCSAWPQTGKITSASKAVPLNWVLGFVSGWATQGEVAVLDMLEPESADAWMNTYCKEHPTDTLPVAARELERQLEAKLPPPPKPPEPPMFVPPQVTPPADAKPAAKPKTVRKAPARKKAAPKA